VNTSHDLDDWSAYSRPAIFKVFLKRDRSNIATKGRTHRLQAYGLGNLTGLPEASLVDSPNSGSPFRTSLLKTGPSLQAK